MRLLKLLGVAKRLGSRIWLGNAPHFSAPSYRNDPVLLVQWHVCLAFEKIDYGMLSCSINLQGLPLLML